MPVLGRVQGEMGNLGGGMVLWGPSAVAQQDIPPDYLGLVTKWAGIYGIDWTVLAGVLKVACDFGRHCGVSSAGAVGPAQFEPPTWAAYGVDGDGDGRKDALDPADAVAGAANYLKILGAGAPAEQRAALCHYNAGALPAFGIVAAVLGIVNTMALSIIERTRELGLLRSIGLTRRQTRTMVRWESVLIAFLGMVLGTILGIALGVAVVRALASTGVGHISVPIGQLGIFALGALIIGLLAAILPGRRAARLNILDAIATE